MPPWARELRARFSPLLHAIPYGGSVTMTPPQPFSHLAAVAVVDGHDLIVVVRGHAFTRPLRYWAPSASSHGGRRFVDAAHLTTVKRRHASDPLTDGQSAAGN